MSINRAMLTAAALIFGATLSLYLYVHGLAHALFHKSTKLSAAACDDLSASSSNINPNKMLFISCGGFID